VAEQSGPTNPRFPRGNALAAAVGYVVGFAVLIGAWYAANEQHRASTMERYGNALAEELAQLALEPLLAQDRIRLGRLAERRAQRPEVRRIAVYTVDDRLFVVAGEAATGNTLTYIRPIAVEDTVAGDVHVSLNRASFGLSAAQLLTLAWPFVLAGLVLTAGVFHYLARPRRPAMVQATGDGDDSEQAYLLVASLYPDSNVAGRKDLLRRGTAVAQRVANLYAATVVELPDSGTVLEFQATSSPDRGFEVVCAALLVRRLLERIGDPGSPEDGGSAGRLFRYGLELVRETGDGASAQTQEVPQTGRFHTASVLLLSSLAPNGELVIGRHAYDAVERPERLELEALDNPATRALSSTVTIPSGVVRGVGDDYDALLEKQADVIAQTLD